MADDDLKDLMNAREVLVQKRHTCAQTIAAPDEDFRECDSIARRDSTSDRSDRLCDRRA